MNAPIMIWLFLPSQTCKRDSPIIYLFGPATACPNIYASNSHSLLGKNIGIFLSSFSGYISSGVYLPGQARSIKHLEFALYHIKWNYWSNYRWDRRKKKNFGPRLIRNWVIASDEWDSCFSFAHWQEEGKNRSLIHSYGVGPNIIQCQIVMDAGN